MVKLNWDSIGERFYETGVDRGVLFVDSDPGVVWNGLTSVTEKPTGGTPDPIYLDGFKCRNEASKVEFSATLEAYTYPDEFLVCDGMLSDGYGLFFDEQDRKEFSLSYRTQIGNDISGTSLGYKIHFLYNALATPSSRAYQSSGDSVDAITFSWNISARPIEIPNRKPTAHLIIDSRKIHPRTLRQIEDALYGTDVSSSHILTPQELIDMIQLGQPIEIHPQPISGLSTLSPGYGDLHRTLVDGFYTAADETRLTATGIPGLYTLEQNV